MVFFKKFLRPAKRKMFAVGVTAAVSLFALSAILYPDLFQQFLTVLPQLDERGVTNPSMLAFLRDVSDLVGRGHFPGAVATGFYFALSIGVLGISFRALWRYRASAPVVDAQLVFLFLCVVLALVSPRFKNYSQILLLVPTLWILRRRPAQALVPLLAVLTFAVNGETLLPIRDLIGLLSRYITLIATFLLWGYYLKELRQPERPESTEVEQQAVVLDTDHHLQKERSA